MQTTLNTVQKSAKYKNALAVSVYNYKTANCVCNPDVLDFDHLVVQTNADACSFSVNEYIDNLAEDCSTDNYNLFMLDVAKAVNYNYVPFSM